MYYYFINENILTTIKNNDIELCLTQWGHRVKLKNLNNIASEELDPKIS